MPTANLVEHFLRRTGAAMRHVFKALPDGLVHIGTGSYIEKPLIRFRILHYRFRFAFHRQHDRPFGLFQLFHELAGIAPECRD
jgi:hypothetical protein